MGLAVAVYVACTVAVEVLEGVSVAVGGTDVCVLVAMAVYVTEGETGADGVTNGKGVGTVGSTTSAVAATATGGSDVTRCADCTTQPVIPRQKMSSAPVFNSLMLERMLVSLLRILRMNK